MQSVDPAIAWCVENFLTRTTANFWNNVGTDLWFPWTREASGDINSICGIFKSSSAVTPFSVTGLVTLAVLALQYAYMESSSPEGGPHRHENATYSTQKVSQKNVFCNQRTGYVLCRTQLHVLTGNCELIDYTMNAEQNSAAELVLLELTFTEMKTGVHFYFDETLIYTKHFGFSDGNFDYHPLFLEKVWKSNWIPIMITV